ncbi:hypothetical protein V6U90_18915 [Micromonospora sp. CPCC 206060]|uniref:hypothetical protein n=1 Tax=Micromonospora sp. CPCC 206060 TaxID=3122406 RepID=UPI002FF31723
MTPRPAGRQEVGSWFPLALPDGGGWTSRPSRLRLFGSGRHALRALVQLGRREHGWTVLHLPDYYCREAAEAVTGLLPVRYYPADPTGPATVPPPGGPSEAVVSVSYFGAPPVLPPPGSIRIVDATHDPHAPWLPDLDADYVFASLRKTLPLPDGGALWTYRRHPLPPVTPPTPTHLAVVGTMLSAMCLKAAYLAGSPVAKEHYLALYRTAEQGLGSGPVSGISAYSEQALTVLPTAELRQRRIDNVARLAALLTTPAGVRVHPRPLGVVLEFDSPEHREQVRADLIGADVYPAVLWPQPLDEASPTALDFSRRMLFLHSDFRSDGPDLARVAALVRRSCGEPTPVINPPRCGAVAPAATTTPEHLPIPVQPN